MQMNVPCDWNYRQLYCMTETMQWKISCESKYANECLLWLKIYTWMYLVTETMQTTLLCDWNYVMKNTLWMKICTKCTWICTATENIEKMPIWLNAFSDGKDAV